MSTPPTADADLALQLADWGRATGPAADELRRCLREAILADADDAEAYAYALSRPERDIAVNIVRHARAVAQDPVVDPAANLRLLAKSAHYTYRYALAWRRQPQRPDDPAPQR